MHIDHIQGPFQALVRDRLRRLLSSGRVPHLLILISPDGNLLLDVSKSFVLDWLGVEWPICHHPDFFELKTSGKAGLHSVSSIREMAVRLNLAPYASSGKAVLIENGDRMLPAASNMLLKLLEEPPDRSLIILATAAPHRLLPTIRSRGQIIRIPAVIDTPLHPNLSPLLENVEPTYAQIVETSDALHGELEEQLKEVCAQRPRDKDLSAKVKKEIAQEDDAEKALWMQEQAKLLLERLYLHLRNRGKCDPSAQITLLQKALDGIERGGNLTTILPWFLSQALQS